MFKGKPPGFYVNLNRYREPRVRHLPTRAPSDYNLGLIFGAFLGSGVVHLSTDNRNGVMVGSVRWYISRQNRDFTEKLAEALEDVLGLNVYIYGREERREGKLHTILVSNRALAYFFRDFLEDGKHLPEMFYVDNKDYLTGLYDGITESRRYKDIQTQMVKPDVRVNELYEGLIIHLGIDDQNE